MSCSKQKQTKQKNYINDYRPIALISIVMKCFEHIILHQLVKHTKPRLDPDATLTLLHNAYTHLEKTGSFVRFLFNDFFFVFSTIQPHLMARTLLKRNINPRLILRIVDFFLNRSQTTRFQAALSSSRSISYGSPQGGNLSPILFTLCANDCSGTDSAPVIKYSDVSAIKDLSNSDSVYFAEVERFSNWCMDISLT